ncbi:Sucrase/ferredoxin-like-domain-containing protein [Sporodiniella umbellata]|nr:Sucrase/ferredoxin-like-domain-containing protein [Sporodiniella umbellata]
MSFSVKKVIGELATFGKDKSLPPAEYLSQDDCAGCQDPCTEHKEYPSYLSINQDIPLLGSLKPYGRHILIATGVSDWSRSIEDETDSFAASLDNVSKSKREWKDLVTNSNALSTYSTLPGACDVLIFPDNLLVSNVTRNKAQEFYDLFMNQSLPTGPSNVEEIAKDHRLGDMKVMTCPYKNLLLLCSHRKRDKRCGVTAPILAQEIDHVLREKGLDEYDAGILMVSHIGGHKLAGNVICYTHQGTRGVWYGRVKTCHVAAIIEETIIQGKVIKELYRGAMAHSFESQPKKSFLSW